MKMRYLLAVLAVLLSVSSNVMAEGQEIAPEKRTAIEKLLETTGGLQLGQQLSSAPEIAHRIQARFKKENIAL